MMPNSSARHLGLEVTLCQPSDRRRQGPNRSNDAPADHQQSEAATAYTRQKRQANEGELSDGNGTALVGALRHAGDGDLRNLNEATDRRLAQFRPGGRRQRIGSSSIGIGRIALDGSFADDLRAGRRRLDQGRWRTGSRQQIVERGHRAPNFGPQAGDHLPPLGLNRRLVHEQRPTGRAFCSEAIAGRPGILARQHVFADHRIGEPCFASDRARKIREAPGQNANTIKPGLGILDIALRLRLRSRDQNALFQRLGRRGLLLDSADEGGSIFRQARIDSAVDRLQRDLVPSQQLFQNGIGRIKGHDQRLEYAARAPDRLARLEDHRVCRRKRASASGAPQLRPGLCELNRERRGKRNR
jgi:hypothetical protein